MTLQAFEDHQKGSDARIERLEKAFKLMDKPVSASHCGSAISFARQLNRNDVASLLQASLDEEKAPDEKLTAIAENGVNSAAMKAGK
jgi:ferritin-like metal-binding protein YciE